MFGSEEIKNLRRKLKKARENGKLQEISDCCCNLAAFLSDEEEHEEALKLYKESLTCCEKLGNKVGAALANRMIAEEFINLGCFEKALQHVSTFLKYSQDEGDKVEEQRGFVLKGHVYFTQAEYLMSAKPKESKKIEQLLEQSMEAYRKSFAICNTELDDISERERLQMKARLLQNKSLVLSRQNKLDSAQAHLIRAIKICTKEKLNGTEHICYLSLGDLYLKRNEPEKALHVYDRALELSHSTQKKRDSLIGKARSYIIMENYKQAKTTLKKAFKLREDDEIKKLLKHVACIIQLENNLCSTPDSDKKSRKELYKKLGNAYCSLKHYKKGIKSYLNMLGCIEKAELNKNDLIKSYSLLCKAFIKDKQYDKALFYSHQEVELLSKWAPERAYKTYWRIAELHELNGSDFEEISFAYSKAKSKAAEFRNEKLKTRCLRKLISIGKSFNKADLVSECKKELKVLKTEDSTSSCDSESGSESDRSSDSENNSDQSSDIDIKELLSDSDVENEEYDRPKERCKRTKFRIKRNEKGETELHVAAIKGNYKRVKQLIDQGHPVNVRDTAGWSPLHEACNHGYVDIVNLLLDFGADINDKGGPSCDGVTPLHDAAINGQFQVIDALIKRGASTLVLNDAGETPLQCLVIWKNHSALDADEEELYETAFKALKSPLDSADIKRHLKPSKIFNEKKSECKKIETEAEERSPSSVKTKKSSAVTEYKETIELLRGKRQAHRRDSGESSEDDDFVGNFRRKSKSAREEYEEAMGEPGFRAKRIIIGSIKPKPKPALISADEYVDNCIMDNDEEDEGEEVGRLTQSPSVVEDDEVYSQPRKRLKSSPFKTRKSSFDQEYKSKPWLEGEEVGRLTQSPSVVEDDEVYSQPKKRLKSSPFRTRKPSLDQECKSKPWLKSIPKDLLEDSFELPKKEDEDGLSSPGCQSEVLTQSPSPHSKSKDTCDITVRIFNERIKISVSRSEIDKLKMNWLIEEVSKKQPTIKNPDNFVHFKIENDSLWESDPLAKVVDSEVECMVTKWKALPLGERYEKICKIASHPDISELRAFHFKHSVQPQVVDLLKKSSKTRTLILSNLKLSSLNLIPICKAIKYETFIQSLDLSKNYFGDKGIELIMKIFEKCIIEELNLSGCNITSTGVYHFSDALNGMNELSKNGLEVLDLSNNPITDDAVEAVNSLIEQLPNLKTLNLDRCELDTKISLNNSTDLTVIQGN